MALALPVMRAISRNVRCRGAIGGVARVDAAATPAVARDVVVHAIELRFARRAVAAGKPLRHREVVHRREGL